MYQYDDVTAVSSRPAPTPAGNPGWFSDGDPVSGNQATILRADFMNMLQAELLAILAAAGIVPDKTKSNQLLQALQAGIFNTPPQFDHSGLPATMAALTRMGMQSSGFTLVSSNTTLTNAVAGGTVQVSNNTGPVTLTLPLTSGIAPAVGRIEVVNSGVFPVTLISQGADRLSHINATTASSGIVLLPGDNLTVVCQGSGIWLAVGGSAELSQSALFGASLSNNGYQKLPSGLIIQWGMTSVTVAANTPTADNWTFPLTFPNACLQAFATPANYVGSIRTAESFTTASCNGFALNSTAVTLSTRRLAIGF